MKFAPAAGLQHIGLKLPMILTIRRGLKPSDWNSWPVFCFQIQASV